MYAKKYCRPVLKSDDVLAEAYDYYMNLRKATSKTFPMSPRYYEALIRMSGAYAKKRLSSLIEECDVAAAVDLLNESLKTYMIDPKTGVIDGGLTQWGRPASRQNRQFEFLLAFKEKAKKSTYPDNMIPVKDWRHHCLTDPGGYSQSEYENFLRYYTTHGIIYSPTPTVFKVTGLFDE